MFFMRMRIRAPLKLSTVIFARGTPRKFTSSRFRLRGRGQLESCMTQPPVVTSRMSRAYVAGFIATIRSKRAVRAVYPSLFARISYQVGSPWMFDGKRFLPETGIPMRKIALRSNPFALADPVPFTVPILKAMSLTRDAVAGSPPFTSTCVSTAISGLRPRPGP